MKNKITTKVKVNKSTQFAVLGFGKFGRSIARTLYDNGLSVLCCDIDEHIVQEVSPYTTHAYQADVSEKAALEKIGIGQRSRLD